MADWITTARPMRIETLRDAALDGTDWEIVALAILAEPASVALPEVAFDVLRRVGIRAIPASPLDIIKLTSIANCLERIIHEHAGAPAGPCPEQYPEADPMRFDG